MTNLSVAQVAALFNVDGSTVRRWIEHGKLPAERLGKRSWLIRQVDLDTFKRPPLGRPKKDTAHEGTPETAEEGRWRV